MRSRPIIVSYKHFWISYPRHERSPPRLLPPRSKRITSFWHFWRGFRMPPFILWAVNILHEASDLFYLYLKLNILSRQRARAVLPFRRRSDKSTKMRECGRQSRALTTPRPHLLKIDACSGWTSSYFKSKMELIITIIMTSTYIMLWYSYKTNKSISKHNLHFRLFSVLSYVMWAIINGGGGECQPYYLNISQ